MNNQSSGRPRITALICTLMEEGNLQHVLPRIPEWVDEILLVDGHSTDRTVDVARKLCPSIRILYQPGKGKGDALKHGIENASGDIIVTLDADGATDPREMDKFVEPLLNGYEFVKGSRLANGCPTNMPRHRWVGNKILVFVTNLLYGTKYTDVCSGYNSYWKHVFLELGLTHDGFEMEQEMNAKIRKVGLKVIEVPCKDKGRLEGSSKTKDVRQGLKDLAIIIRERFRG